MKKIFYITLLILLTTLNSIAKTPLGFLAPKKNTSSPGPAADFYQVKMYNTAEDKETLGNCKINSHFKVEKGSYKKRGRQSTIKCLVDYPFVRVQIDYEFYELATWEQKNKRYKAKVSQNFSNPKVEYLWVEIMPPLKFTNYKSRMLESADSFTKNWDKKLFNTPNSKKYVKLNFSKNLSRLNFTVVKTMKKNGKSWLQINEIEDFDTACEEGESAELPYKNLWIPMINKKGDYNVKAFSNPRGC